jgi:hypothetical protein
MADNEIIKLILQGDKDKFRILEPPLDKLGVAYDPDKKYKAVNGEDIGLPEHPQVLKCC